MNIKVWSFWSTVYRHKVIVKLVFPIKVTWVTAWFNHPVIWPSPCCCLSWATKIIVLPNNVALCETPLNEKTATVTPMCWATQTTGRWTAHRGDLHFCKVVRKEKKKKDGKTPKYGILETVCLRRDQSVFPALCLSVCTNPWGVWTLTRFKRSVHLSGLHWWGSY